MRMCEMTDRNETIGKIIEIEWEMFDKVSNIGGRASCQDDLRTFQIMRRSQYENWNDAMLDIYIRWISEKLEAGENPVEEKYARMMEYSDPAYYEERIKPFIPSISDEKKRLIDEITSVLTKWEGEFAKNYPYLSAASRPVYSNEDAGGFTSVETYNRGELSTYPEELLEEYLKYVKRLEKEGKTISVMDRETMSALYGFSSIDDAEKAMEKAVKRRSGAALY